MLNQVLVFVALMLFVQFALVILIVVVVVAVAHAVVVRIVDEFVVLFDNSLGRQTLVDFVNSFVELLERILNLMKSVEVVA